jgi:antitoxin StbD
MVAVIHTPFTASISDLKKNPTEVALSGDGEAVAILNRNKPAFYCVPPELYQRMIDALKQQDQS